MVLSTKTEKCMGNPLYGETKLHYQKTCLLLSVFEHGRHRNAKMSGSHLTWGIQKQHYEKTCLSVFLKFLRTKTLKTHAKPPLWWINRKINKYFQCFWACCLQKHENGCNVHLMGKEKKRRHVLWMFSSFLGTRTLKLMSSTLYGDILWVHFTLLGAKTSK